MTKKFIIFYKIVLFFVFVAVILASGVVLFYIHTLPLLVKNPKTIELVKQEISKNFNMDIDIKNPILATHLTPELEFTVESIFITKEGIKILDIKNLDTAVSLSQVFKKKVILKKLVFDNVFIDANKIMELTEGQKQQEPVKIDWDIKWEDAILSLKNLLVLYTPDGETNIKLTGKNIEITNLSGYKYLHFDINTEIKRNKYLSLTFKDNNSAYIKDNKLYLDNFSFNINKSKIFINSVFDGSNHFNISLVSKRFNIEDAVELVNSNLFVPNGDEMLIYFDKIKGYSNFNINVSDSDINGRINVGSLNLNLIPINNLPVAVSSGYVTFDNNEILLKDFKGYYGKSKNNKAVLEGKVSDYLKSVDTEIVIKGLATNELTKDYISKLANCKIELLDAAPTKLTINSIYNKIDINWIFYVKRENDILLEGASFSPLHYDRALKADFHIENDLFVIKSIDYYIAQEMKRGMDIKPIITITGNLNALDFGIRDIGFNINRPLPSEFLNLFVGEKIFKKGTISGHLHYITTGRSPMLKGKLNMDGVRIPSQKLSIKKGTLTTDNNLIYLNADGRFRRTNYHFKGYISNNIVLPIVVKDVTLEIEDIDMDRLMASLNKDQMKAQAANPQPAQKTNIEDEESDTPFVYTPNLIMIEKCNFKLDKGIYKKINFGNIDAKLTLDKDGNLDIQSNWFDFAEGISTLRVKCDLAKSKYYIRLGCKNVNVDTVATSILELEKEITGKASALLEFNTDDKFKLNGLIRFTVIDGTISKLGLVQYVLNVAALFRNPLAMISPSTIVDLVNVPEGSFELIDGELNIKDNIIQRMKIKSKSPQLSAFIAGRYNLENRDTSLRIYTKFSSKHKGITGFLRNISLNTLAKRFSMSERNDMNYYSAEISQLPEIDAKEEDCQIFLTKVEGDVENNNFISSLKKLK